MYRGNDKISVPINYSPEPSLLYCGQSVPKRICIFKLHRENDLSDAVYISGFVPLPAAPLTHIDREEPIGP